jgi:CrcB protein
VPTAVALGGAIGTVARYELAVSVPATPGAFPWSTFVVNVVGSLVVGAVIAWCITGTRVPPWVRPFAAVGVCGGLTTFSTWMVTDVLLLRDGNGATAAVDLAATLVAGLVAVSLGFVLTRRLLGARGAIVLDPGDAD